MKGDPKAFYDTTLPQRQNTSYEEGRWNKSPLMGAQYVMMMDVMNSVVCPFFQGISALEIGPGPGTWTKFLLKNAPNASFTLVDISKEMLRQAQDALGDTHTYVESDWLSFTSKNTFDFFFSSRAIEYVTNKEHAIRIIAKLLISGGRGVLITKMPKPFSDELRGRIIDDLHTGQIAPQELLRLLREANFKICGVRIATATFPLLASPLLNRFLYSLLKSIPLIAPLRVFAESYVVLFEKI